MTADQQIDAVCGSIDAALAETRVALSLILPASPDDTMPPPDWPYWQLCHQLQQAKLLLSSALRDLAEP